MWADTKKWQEKIVIHAHWKKLDVLSAGTRRALRERMMEPTKKVNTISLGL